MPGTPARRALFLAPVLVLGAVVPLVAGSAAGAAHASSSSTPFLRQMTRAAVTHYTATPAGLGAVGDHELAPDLQGAGDAATNGPGQGHAVANRSLAARNHTATTVPLAATSAASLEAAPATTPHTLPFEGLNMLAQRTANGGNQFSVEPPDQALCVGGGHVVEAVNDVARVYSTGGAPQTGVTDLNTLLGYPAQFDRTSGLEGPFVTDPTCHFDAATGTFFLVTLTLDVVPSTGAFTGGNTLDVAVSKDPTKTWTVYHLQVRDDGVGGTPTHPGCPCIGDYPHIGADANGFYITTNEYPFFADGFVAAQVYAFPKAVLASGAASVPVLQFDTSGMDAGKPGFTVWPAISPAGQFAASNRGTEYLLSSNAAEEVNNGSYVTSTSVVAWALTGTSTLGSRRPAVTLSSQRVSTAPYSLPPQATQKAGSVPLADCLNLAQCSKLLLGKPNKFHEVEGRLDANDTRMQQVTYAGGRIYGALDTAVDVGSTRAGIAYYVVTPTPVGSSVTYSLAANGTFGVAGNDVTYPTIGVTAEGRGIMSFTLTGADYYPSQAFATFDATHAPAGVQVAFAGLGPQDGFSEYRAFGDPPRPRWGDYGATALDGSGGIWVATEAIAQTCTVAEYTSGTFGRCGGTRAALGNWSTLITKVTP